MEFFLNDEDIQLILERKKTFIENTIQSFLKICNVFWGTPPVCFLLSLAWLQDISGCNTVCGSGEFIIFKISKLYEI